MNRWTLALLIVVIGLILTALFLPIPYYSTSSTSPSTSSKEIRGAIDIGSGATNLRVAEVDRNTDKIISHLFEQSIPVPYQKHLELSSNNTFDQEVMAQGMRAIKQLKDQAERHGVKKIVAIATAAFRRAANAPEFARQIETETGIRVHIIDQDEEGILAFRGALATTPLQPQQTIVWDIGGGSMQLTTLTDVGSYLVEKGKTASIPYKNAIIEQVKHQNPQVVSSPNPLNGTEIQHALFLAHQAAEMTHPYIKDKIANPENKVLAVGSLFNFGIKPIVNKSLVTQRELVAAIKKDVGKTDAELPGGALAEVAVSNPLLVLGYMEALNIQEVEILNINNADGALTYPPYW